MRARHRIPTIFNLSMVDVLCCALGCVILLWLVNFREAKRRAAVAGETSIILDETRTRLDQATLESADFRLRLAAAEQKLRDLQADRDAVARERTRLQDELSQGKTRMAALEKDLTKARADMLATDKDAAKLRADMLATEDRLSKKAQDYVILTKDKEALLKQLADQLKLLREKETLATTTAKSADELVLKLKDLEAKLRALQALADLLPKLQDEAKTYKDKLSLADLRLLTLQKDLGNQKAAADKAERARVVAENRFAGIAMTGRRVAFLIDMSGSMDYLDEKTQAPEKWSAVSATLSRILRSLTDLEKFQVILFSEKASYLLGSDDRWLSYEPKTSPEQAGKALAAVKPKGNTNMYAAFEAAFRLRPDGLDTIYLLSDGLPNYGAGLTAEKAKTLTEIERSTAYSQHVLRTLRTTWNRPATDKSKVRINAVGFFYESPDVGAFLWALARDNDGSFVGMSQP